MRENLVSTVLVQLAQEMFFPEEGDVARHLASASFHLFPLHSVPHLRIRVANLLDGNNGGGREGGGDKWLIISVELLA